MFRSRVAEIDIAEVKVRWAWGLFGQFGDPLYRLVLPTQFLGRKHDDFIQNEKSQLHEYVRRAFDKIVANRLVCATVNFTSPRGILQIVKSRLKFIKILSKLLII